MTGRMAGYLVKELFGPTLQGEGAHAGRPCVFLRFAGCNLACTWCDTDFRAEGAARLSAAEIAARLLALDVNRSRMVVVTGGEPSLQWDAPLAEAIAATGFRAHMESNGTRALAAPVDWLTVSPKPRFHEDRFELVLRRGDELKLVVDDTVDDGALDSFERMEFGAFYAQPCMDARYDQHLRRTLELVGRHPRWRLSLQLHKIVGIP
jgi:7-carboxy-7-deazaguanine synthase